MSTQKKIIIIVTIVIVVLVAIKVIGALNRKSEIEELSMPTDMMFPPIETSLTTEPEIVVETTQVAGPEAQVSVQTPAPSQTAVASFSMTNENIQKALKAAGFDPGSIDGKIGKKTTAAIIEFQKANNLTPDGKVGPRTWAKLSTFLGSGQ